MSHLSVFRNFCETFFKYKNAVFNSVQEKDSIICVRVGWRNPYLAITICHHSASPVMPNGDPWDRPHTIVPGDKKIGRRMWKLYSALEMIFHVVYTLIKGHNS